MIAAPTDLLRRVDASRTPVERLLATLSVGEGEPSHRRPVRPWTLLTSGTEIELRLSPLGIGLDDAANREMVMVCGAVVENLAIAANLQGRAFRVEPFPAGDGATVARLTLDACVSPRREEEVLHRVIDGDDRLASPVEGGALSPALVALLRHGARSAGGRLDVVADDRRRELLADLQVEAASIADARRDSARRVSLPTRVEAGAGTSLEYEGGSRLDDLLPALGARFAARTAGHSTLASQPRSATIDAPLLAVLGTRGDAPGDWLSAGRALQRVLLHATAQGLYATLLNGALRESRVRDAVRSIPPSGWSPQAIVRLDVDAGPAHRVGCDTGAAH